MRQGTLTLSLQVCVANVIRIQLPLVAKALSEELAGNAEAEDVSQTADGPNLQLVCLYRLLQDPTQKFLMHSHLGP